MKIIVMNLCIYLYYCLNINKYYGIYNMNVCLLIKT